MYRIVKEYELIRSKESVEKTKYVKNMFGEISARYDLLNWIMTLGKHRKWREKAAVIACTGNDRQALSVLDVASGTGDFAFQISKHENVNHITAMDLSEEMLMIAKRKSENVKSSCDTDFLVCDVMHMPFPDDLFSVVTVGFGFRNFVDLERGLSEMIRVAEPGGKVVILEIVKPEGILMSKIFPVYFRRLTPLLGSLFAGNVEAYKYLPESVNNFVSSSQIKTMMEMVGLKNVSVERLAMGSVGIISGTKF